jgi:CHAD domain-containing protein
MRRVRPARPVLANFRRILPRLLRRYFRRGRALAADSRATSEQLHCFRIRTKRIRYVTELYAEVFERELRGALAQFRGIQQTLGAHQDQSMIAAYFEGRLKKVKSATFKKEYRRLLERSRKRQESLRKVFFRRWRRLERSGFERGLLQRIKQLTA